MLEKIKQILDEVQSLTAATPEEAEALRIKYLSKKGEISALMDEFRTVPAEMKKELGKRINELKTCATERINQLGRCCCARDRGRRPRSHTHALSHSSGHASSAHHRQERDCRHLLTSRLHACRRT